MDWPSVMMVVGIAVSCVGCSFILAAHFLKARAIQRFATATILDFYMSLVWGGMATLQIASAFLHRQPDGQFEITLLAFAANIAAIIATGIFMGRLLLRWQMRGESQAEKPPVNRPGNDAGLR